ncbi:MAG: hypothetical protein WAM72_22980, partial [Xanthobacteraceae bacterium]
MRLTPSSGVAFLAVTRADAVLVDELAANSRLPRFRHLDDKSIKFCLYRSVDYRLIRQFLRWFMP